MLNEPSRHERLQRIREDRIKFRQLMLIILAVIAALAGVRSITIWIYGFFVWVCANKLQGWNLSLIRPVTSDILAHHVEYQNVLATGFIVIATIFLWKATKKLADATVVATATQGPFLRVILYPDGGYNGLAVESDNLRNFYYPDYDTAFQVDDHLNNFPSTEDRNSRRYINVICQNIVNNPLALAANVEINITFTPTRSSTGGAPLISPVKRTIRFACIEAGITFTARVFQFDQIPDFLVTIDSVQYNDIMARERTAGVGPSILSRTQSQQPILTTIKVFEPRKKEFTDGF